MENIADINARVIGQWVRDGWIYGRPIDHETFMKAKAGEWAVSLTPVRPVPKAWFGDLEGRRLLGLASGGAQQMPVLTAAGAICTVLDYTPEQLESERTVAQREGYEIDIVRADMSKPLPFEDKSFDIIFHPVSNCYVRQVDPIWRECHRILKPGGRLLSGLDNGINYVLDDGDSGRITGRLPFDPIANADQRAESEARGDGMQFSHTLEDQIGGQLRAGFILKDVYEDTWANGLLHDLNIPAFWATLAVKA